MMDGFFFSFLLVIVDGVREGEKKKKKKEARCFEKNKKPRALLRRKNFT